MNTDLVTESLTLLGGGDFPHVAEPDPFVYIPVSDLYTTVRYMWRNDGTCYAVGTQTNGGGTRRGRSCSNSAT